MNGYRHTARNHAGAMSVRVLVLCAAVFALLLCASACSTRGTAVGPQDQTVTSVDGSRIACGVEGQGETVLVFVHGWLGDHTLWQHQIDHFSRSYKVLWLDLAGHGASEAARQDFTMSAFGQDVAAACNACGGERLVLVGHSMGGPVVIEAAELLGDKVVGIVGVDAFHTPLANVPLEKKMKFLGWLKSDYPAALESTVRAMFVQGADEKRFERAYGSMLAADRKMGISALYECMLWNAHKEPQALVQYAGKLRNINGAPNGDERPLHESVALIPGAGHFMFQARPEAFNAALEQALKGFAGS